MLKKCVTLFMMATIFLPQSVYADIDSISSAINVSGRQRMLTQRILKSYCEVGMDESYSFHDAEGQLADALSLFEAQLLELEQYVEDEKIRKALQVVRSLWAPYQKIASETPTRDGAEQLLSMNDELLGAAHKVVLLLEDFSGTQAGRLVNMSGRQRMLSQRLAKFYMLESWKFAGAEIDSEKNQTTSEFEGGFAVLQEADINTAQINNLLKKVGYQWAFFRNRLEVSRVESTPMLVGLTAEKLLKQLDDLTHMYVKLGEN